MVRPSANQGYGALAWIIYSSHFQKTKIGAPSLRHLYACGCAEVAGSRAALQARTRVWRSMRYSGDESTFAAAAVCLSFLRAAE